VDKVTGVICHMGLLIVILLNLGIALFPKDPNIQHIMIRTINSVFVFIGIYNSAAIFIYGGQLEKKLLPHRYNQEHANSIKRIRYVFAMTILVFSSGIYPIFAIYPTLMQYIYPLGLSLGGGVLLFVWKMRTIQKKIGLYKPPNTTSFSFSHTNKVKELT